MKLPPVIITAPAKIREICLNQPPVSREEAEASILEQLGKLPPSIREIYSIPEGALERELELIRSSTPEENQRQMDLLKLPPRR